MLANHIVGKYKVVLFIDNVGIEQNGVKIVENLLIENNVIFEKNINENCEINQKRSLILDPVSKLELNKSDQEIFTLIQTLKNNENVNQLFIWATTKNISSKILIPFLDYMSDITVNIKLNNILSILTKKKSSNVKLKEYQHELVNGKTTLKEIIQKIVPKEEVTKAEDPEVIGTFKIGQFNNNELEAKKNLKLPFEIIDLPSAKESKIIYTPESVDDFDEEDDPDNDLQF